MYNSIIYQLISNASPDVLMDFLLSFFKNQVNLVTLLSFSKEFYSELVLNFIRITLETQDELLYQSVKNKKRYLVHSYRPRMIDTAFGVLSFSRRYYCDSWSGTYVYLLDEQLGIERYQRFSQDVRMNGIKQATEYSYRKTAALSQANVSHSSIRNWVLDYYEQTKEAELFSDELIEKHQSKLVFVEADEDHVIMTHGKHKLLKLVYIHEGYEKKKGRNQLVHPFRNYRHLCGSRA